MKRAASDELIVPADVLHELFHMVATRLSYRRAIDFQKVVRVSFDIASLTTADYERMQAIMALTERLGITQVYTFDRRDFSIFRPAHCDFLQLLPA